MNELKSRRARSDMQDYENQRYIGSQLDDGVFDALNTTDYIGFLYSAGLDAPDFMPTGSMVYVHGNYYDRGTCERGVSLADKMAIDAFMNTFMSELKNERTN